MAIYRTYACDACGNEWEVFHMSADEPAPDGCPFCNAVPEAPYLALPRGGKIGGSNMARGVNWAYSELERTSEVRAEMADAPQLKVTNLRDNLRMGDVAAVGPQPSRDYIEATAAMGMAPGFNASMAQSAVAGGKAGPNQGGGHRVGRSIATDHSSPHRRMTGVFVDPRKQDK